MKYESGQKIYFQFHPDYEDDTWYPGTILRHSDITECYEIVVKKHWRHYFAPPTRIQCSPAPPLEFQCTSSLLC